MTDQEFIKQIKKTGRKGIIIGIGISLFAIFMIWLALSGVDSEMTNGTMITVLIMGGVFLAVGLLMLIMPLRASSKIRNGKHELVNAIQNQDSGYIVWFYEYITTVRSGPASNTDHKIWAFSRNNKHYSIDVKKAKVHDLIAYFSAKFPTATVGYTKELEDDYKRRMKELK